MKDDDKIKKIVWTGLLTAMVAVGTMIRVPYPMIRIAPSAHKISY